MLRWIELYYRASRLHHSLCCIFSPFNGSLLLLFSSFSLDVIQVLPIILPFKKNLECYDSSFLADDPGVRVVNKSPGVGGCVCVCVYIYKHGSQDNNTFLNDCRDAGITPAVTTITVSGTAFLSTFPYVFCPLRGSRHINANNFSIYLLKNSPLLAYFPSYFCFPFKLTAFP